MLNRLRHWLDALLAAEQRGDEKGYTIASGGGVCLIWLHDQSVAAEPKRLKSSSE